jgi:hypothetical protein
LVKTSKITINIDLLKSFLKLVSINFFKRKKLRKKSWAFSSLVVVKWRKEIKKDVLKVKIAHYYFGVFN